MVARPRIALLFPSTPLYRELGSIVAEQVRALGFPCRLAHRVRRGLLDADLLWITGWAPSRLMGRSASIPGLGRLLARRRAGNPRIAFWLLEPLPPLAISNEGLEIGRRVARWRYPTLWRPLHMLLEPWRPLVRRVVNARRDALAGEYLARIAADPAHDGWGRCTVECLMRTMREVAWLEQAIAEGWIDHFFTSTRPRARFLRRLGVRARLMPVGGHPHWGTPPADAAPRDVDVLLLAGLDDPRRVSLAEAIDRSLRARGSGLLTIGRGLYGDDRTALLRRTRVVINLPRFPYDFAAMRMPMALGCGAAVVSEAEGDTWPWRAGIHFEAAHAEGLADATWALLADEPLRRERVAEGRRLIDGPLALRRLMARALRVVFPEVPS